VSHFFIERPIFAWVIALVIMLAGAIAIVRLPIAQYPNIAPPTITIQATYPGASARTVEDTVTQIIEQRMTGLDGLRYITSTSDSLGAASIVLTFNAGVNPDIAQVQVQNKLKLAETLLPQEVQQQGVNVVKTVRNFIMVIGFYSEDGSMNRTAIRNAVRNADLARSGQIEQLQAHARGCRCRRSLAERADRCRTARWAARRAGTATERDHIGTRPAADSRAVRVDRVAHGSVRCHGAATRRRPRRARR
jgi:multidrug efflux pump subunit AcrB